MTTKGKPETPKPVAQPGSGKAVANFAKPDDPVKADALAELALTPEANAAIVLEQFAKSLGPLDVGSLSVAVAKGVKAINDGDMREAEAMLYGQAHALQAIFASYARRAQVQQYQSNLEAFMKMALKAQNQCRMTLETLANIKNPPVVFARQANINNGGQQQVNNGSAASKPGESSRARKTAIEQSKLLEAPNGERMDYGTKSKAGRAHPRMATVGAIKRPQDRGR